MFDRDRKEQRERRNKHVTSLRMETIERTNKVLSRKRFDSKHCRGMSAIIEVAVCTEAVSRSPATDSWI